jgi:hypothetical protein
MTIRRTDALTLAVLALAATATAAVAVRSARPARERADSREFQRLVHGLGLGPATDLSRDESAFDPRVGAVCPERFHPILAGDAFCPDRTGANVAR